jgi:predicted ABC-class ATPase
MTLAFGKYSGKHICDVPTEYLVWAMKAYPLQPAQRVLIREEVLRRLGADVATCSSPVSPALRPLAEKLVVSAADFQAKQAENEGELTQILAVRDILLSVIWGSDASAAVEASRLASWSLPAVRDLPEKALLKGYGEIWLGCVPDFQQKREWVMMFRERKNKPSREEGERNTDDPEEG